jgi:hypothetical protein
MASKLCLWVGAGLGNRPPEQEHPVERQGAGTGAAQMSAPPVRTPDGRPARGKNSTTKRNVPYPAATRAPTRPLRALARGEPPAQGEKHDALVGAEFIKWVMGWRGRAGPPSREDHGQGASPHAAPQSPLMKLPMRPAPRPRRHQRGDESPIRAKKDLPQHARQRARSRRSTPEHPRGRTCRPSHRRTMAHGVGPDCP